MLRAIEYCPCWTVLYCYGSGPIPGPLATLKFILLTLILLIYTKYMAVPAERMRTAPVRLIKSETLGEPENNYGFPLPRGSFIDLLHPQIPRRNYDSLPSYLNLSVLGAPTEKVYDASHRPEVGVSKIQSREEVIFLDAHISSATYPKVDRNQKGESVNDVVEAGMNIYVNPYDNRAYLSDIQRGTYQELEALTRDVSEHSQRGENIAYQMHTHPSEFPPYPTLQDWMVALHVRNGMPVVNALTVLGDGIQVMAVMTDKSPLFTDDEANKFYREWENKFLRSGGKVQTQWYKDLKRLNGSAYIEARHEYDRYIDHAVKQVSLALTHALSPKIYISTNMVDFNTARPEEVMQIINVESKFKNL